MKRTLILIFIFFSNIIRAYSFTETESSSMDMELYSTIAGYAIFALVGVMFGILIYYSHRDFEEDKIQIVKPSAVFAGKVNAELFITLNRIYYSIIVLIVIYFALFILMIL